MASDDFEQFVQWRCEMERSARFDTVLKEAGISRVQWTAIERRWLRRLANEAEHGGGPLTRAYAAAFGPLVEAHVAPVPQAPAPQPATPAIPVAPMTSPAISKAPAVEMTAIGGMSPIRDTPFASEQPTAAPAPAAEQVAHEAEAMVGETGFVSALVIEEALPFPASEAAPPSAQNVDATAHVSALVVDDEPLPFDRDGQSSAPAPVAEEVEREAAGLVGGTAFASALSDADMATTLTLEQYASLRADLDRPGADRTAVLTRYQVIDEDHFVSLERHWSNAFAEDPTAYGRFRAAYDAYNRWFEGP